MATSASWRLCRYPGCTKPTYKEPSGYTHEFCGRTHASMMTKATRFTSPISSSSTYLTSKSTSSKSKKSSGLTPLKAFQSFIKPSKSNEIKFYNRFEDYYEFTNFYPVCITIDGVSWPSSEHYFQAQKFVGTPYVEKIRKMSSARETFQFSRNLAVSRWRRSDWDQVKDGIMLKALRCKFGESKLCSLLVNTGDKKLIEHTVNDSYWGDGGDGKGLNKLGQLLMQVRGELQQKQASVSQESSKSLLKRSYSLSSHTKKESKPKNICTDDMDIATKSTRSFYSSSSSPLRRYGSHGSLLSVGHTSPLLIRKSFSTSKSACSNPPSKSSSISPPSTTQHIACHYSKLNTAPYNPTGSRQIKTPQLVLRRNDSSQVTNCISWV